MSLRIETEREVDGRWVAEILDLPGVMFYGDTRESAIADAGDPKSWGLPIIGSQPA
jgi:predicted RNase H-like HicB family nuclease